MSGFRGGVHPVEYKQTTEHLPVETPPLPPRVWIPMSQHIGAPSTAIVSKGDYVRTGQLIGRAAAAVSVPTHSSVSGTVADVVLLPHPLTGRRVTTVVLDSDGSDKLDDAIKERDDSTLVPAELLQIIRDAGIVGLGGAAFPTHIKLAPPAGKTIDTLLINGCECEPYLTADHRLMLEKTAEVIGGARIIARILNVRRTVIAVEDNKPDAIAQLNRHAGDIEIKRLRTKYPQGAEKQLIKACTGREVPSGGLPMDVGCIVQNVGTAVAVYDAVRFGRPLYQRIVTVTGPAIVTPKNLMVRIGTPVKDLIAFCGGYRNEPAKLIIGGPMMGIAVSTDDVPVLKSTSGVLVLDKAAAAEPAESSCIRCGSCIRACPMGLAPQRLFNHIRRKRLGAAEQEHVLDCIECGCCAWSCPAKIRLVQHFKYAKAEINAKRK